MLRHLKEKYGANRTRKLWNLFLLVVFASALFFPDELSGPLGLSHRIAVWDAAAIAVSIILTVIYFGQVRAAGKKMLDGTTPPRVTSMGVNFVEDCGLLAVVALLLLGFAYYSLMRGRYLPMIGSILTTVIIYIGIGAYRTRVFQARLDSLTLTSAARKEIEDEILIAKHDMCYGDFPTFVGFVILLVFLLRQQPTPAAHAHFVAGGAALHMLFGNVVVGLSLK